MNLRKLRPQHKALLVVMLILSALLVHCLTSPKIKQDKTKQIVMYGRMSCPFTEKAVQRLKKDGMWGNVRFVDTETPEGSAEFETKPVDGVPYFENPSNGKDAVGYMPTKVLLHKLEI